MLTTCPDCSATVSDKADACPKCGHPIAGRRSEGLFLQTLNVGCFIALALALAVVVIMIV